MRWSGIRLPPFEVSLLLVIGAIGWAGYELYRTTTQLERSRTAPILVAPAARPDPAAAESIFRLQGDFVLKEEYLALADLVRTNMQAVHESFLAYIKNQRNAPNESRFRTLSTELQTRLKKEKERLHSEHLDARSVRLRERMASEHSSPTNRPLALQRDLGTVAAELDREYAGYLASTKTALEKRGRLFATDVGIRELEDVEARAARLLKLSEETRADARNVDDFLQHQVKSGLAVLTPPTGVVAIPPPIGQLHAGTLQKVLYAVVFALVTLGCVLLVALYRRTVVSSLRNQLVESSAIIDQQRKLEHFGQLAAGLAHEIRNPLTAINARLYTLQKTLSAGSPEHQDAGVIRNEIHRLDGIVRDFLILARPAEPKLVPTTAEPILKEVAELMTPQLERRAVTLRMDGMVPDRFGADTAQLKQVLINLVRNAADSIEGIGAVTLRAKKERVEIKGKSTPAVVLEVEDTGSGIPPEVQGRLFDPFFSTKETGTGLGLSIAARIIDKHGAVLGFETRAGEGTTFRISLPVTG